jgi:hypothetical protein
VASVVLQDVVDERGGVGAGHRSEDDDHKGPASEDVDGGELAHLADTFQVPHVEAVQADELAGTPAGQAEPEGVVFFGRLGHEPCRHHADGRRPGHPLGTAHSDRDGECH